MSAPLRLMVFDVDGTLVDSQRQILASMDAAFAGQGLPVPSASETLSIVGLSLPVAIARLVPHASEPLVARLAEGYRTAFAGLRSDDMPMPLYPGARAALDELARDADLLLGVATGKSRRGLDHVLQQHALHSYFVTTQVADDHPSKPHPSMLAATLRETGVDASAAVMVGDTTYDIEMGRAAGFRTIAVDWGYHSVTQLRGCGADVVIGGFGELLPALKHLRMLPA